jgi:hypothetical protein
MRYLVILTVLLLQGCAGAMLVAGVAGMATVEVTGKSASDHVISAVNDKDCKMSRSMQGKDVCQDQPDPEPVVVAKDRPKLDIPPVVPQPKRIVIVQTTVDRAEDVFAQRKLTK